MKDLSDEEFSASTNRIINDSSPLARVTFARELQNHLFYLLSVPVPILEQVITKLEVEHNEYKDKPMSPLTKTLLELFEVDITRSNRNAERCIGSLKAFLAVRMELLHNLKEQLPADLIPKSIV